LTKLSDTAILILVGAIVLLISFSNYLEQHPPKIYTGDIRVGSYNMQIFGLDKSSNYQLMEKYKILIRTYDVFFIQEIRDESGIAFKQLCELVNYSCISSSRAGTTKSKEQYGVMWSNRVKFLNFTDYNTESFNLTTSFERPPIRAEFEIQNKTIYFYEIHTKPDNTPQEIDNLEKIVRLEGFQYVAVLGDLNMDCDYYKNSSNFRGWYYLISDDMDTTVGDTICAYDRIIVSSELKILISSSGVDTLVDNTMSDHFPVFFSFSKPSNS
jgi:deoxyribonuclease-1/deoxyribonuclease-1-like protein